MLFELAYISRASELFGQHDLHSLLQQSRSFNVDNSISGMLLYKDCSFLQVIEGEKATIQSLYESIKLDPRHYDVRLIFSRPLQSRNFAKWSMGFFDLEHQAVDVEDPHSQSISFIFPEQIMQQNLSDEINQSTAKELILAFTRLA